MRHRQSQQATIGNLFTCRMGTSPGLQNTEHFHQRSLIVPHLIRGAISRSIVCLGSVSAVLCKGLAWFPVTVSSSRPCRRRRLRQGGMNCPSQIPAIPPAAPWDIQFRLLGAISLTFPSAERSVLSDPFVAGRICIPRFPARCSPQQNHSNLEQRVERRVAAMLGGRDGLAVETDVSTWSRQ